MSKQLRLNLQFFSDGLSFQKDNTVMSPEDWKLYRQHQKEQETKRNRPYFSTNYGGGVVKTAGEIVAESQAYKSFITNGQKQSDIIAIPNTKALVTSRTADGDLMTDMPIIGGAEMPLTMRNVLNMAQTDTNAIDYLRETGFTNASAIAPEGSLKPESSMTFENVTSLVRTIAHHIPVTRQAVADIPQLQNHINNRLMYGLSVTEEAQIMYGDGVGDNIQGIMTDPDIQVYTPLAEDNMIDTLRKAMSLVYLSGYPATAIIMHPSDWEEIELSKGGDGHYLFPTLSTGAEPRLFRLPVILTTAIVEGEFLIGAFGLAAQLFVRENAHVKIAETHADDFTRNQLRVLVEERIALAMYRPSAFVRGTYVPAV